MKKFIESEALHELAKQRHEIEQLRERIQKLEEQISICIQLNEKQQTIFESNQELTKRIQKLEELFKDHHSMHCQEQKANELVVETANLKDETIPSLWQDNNGMVVNDFVMKNLIYSENTKSFALRLFNKTKDLENFIFTKLTIQEKAWEVIKEMNDAERELNFSKPRETDVKVTNKDLENEKLCKTCGHQKSNHKDWNTGEYDDKACCILDCDCRKFKPEEQVSVNALPEQEPFILGWMNARQISNNKQWLEQTKFTTDGEIKKAVDSCIEQLNKSYEHWSKEVEIEDISADYLNIQIHKEITQIIHKTFGSD